MKIRSQFEDLWDELYVDVASIMIRYHNKAQTSRVKNHWYKKLQQVFDNQQL